LQLVGALEGLEEPCWAVDDLLLLDPTTSGVHRIRQIGTDFIDQGALPGVVVSPTHGGWDVSYDGRYIVTVDVSEGSWHSVRAYDLQTGTSYLAVSDPNSATWAVTISPDGRYLALISLHLETHVLFVVPFDGANTVTLDSSKPRDGTTLADVSGRIGWCE
jgi:DNA-binding beta-propeller fold protein YncE